MHEKKNEKSKNDESTLENWIDGSRTGDEYSLNRLAEYLLPKAFEFANQKMFELSPVSDFEDVALSAVKSVCLRFKRGDGEFLGEKELGSLLRQFVIGKIRDNRKYHLAEKRNVNRVTENKVTSDNDSSISVALNEKAVEGAKSIWLDEHSVKLPEPDQNYLEKMLEELGADVQGLFSQLVKRLDENPRRVLMMITTGPKVQC